MIEHGIIKINTLTSKTLQESHPMIRPIISLLSPALILVCVSISIRFTLRQVKQNVIAQTEDRIINSYNTLIPTYSCLDPAYRPIFYTFIEDELHKSYLQYITQIQKENNEELTDTFGEISNSDIVSQILSSNKAISEVVNKKKFRSLYDLNAYLLLIGRSDLELKSIEFYLNTLNLNEGQDPTTGDDNRYFTFLCYLQKYYMIPIDNLIKQKQFERAKYLSEHLLTRVKLINTLALDKTNIDNLARINKSYLLAMLLSDTYECYKSATYIDQLIPSFYSQNSLEITESLGSDTKAVETSRLSEGSEKELLDRFRIDIRYPLNSDPDSTTMTSYKSYWRGITLFRSNKFEQAKQEFSKCINSPTSSNLIKDFCRLWLSRCTSWAYINKPIKDKRSSIKEINSQKEKIVLENLKSDVDDYLNYISKLK